MNVDLKERPSSQGADQTALYEGLAGFRMALRKFLAFSEAALHSAGVTSQQYQAMLAIAAGAGEALSMKTLAGELMLKPNGAVQLVDRLEALGMVSRAASDIDRRGVLLTLTTAGTSTLRRLARQHRTELLAHRDLLVESLERLAHIPN